MTLPQPPKKPGEARPFTTFQKAAAIAVAVCVGGALLSFTGWMIFHDSSRPQGVTEAVDETEVTLSGPRPLPRAFEPKPRSLPAGPKADAALPGRGSPAARTLPPLTLPPRTQSTLTSPRAIPSVPALGAKLAGSPSTRPAVVELPQPAGTRSLPTGSVAPPDPHASGPRYVALAVPPPTGTAADAGLDALRKQEQQAAAQHAAKVALDEKLRFVMSLCADQQGNIWIGTEDYGVFRYNPDAPEGQQYTQFTTKDGLGDDNGYALACDHQGRIWMGHLNHGVSVCNGQRWLNYEVVGGLSRPDSLSGPLGERVFAIAVCPTDGDVWIATNCGLARYHQKQDNWLYYTRAEGLPSDQASSLAFDDRGDVYVGTQCDGIAMADAEDHYQTWRSAVCPPRLLAEPAGEGLPTNLINGLLVRRDGTIYAATSSGLAWSENHGQSWRHLRGRDWAERSRGQAGGPPSQWRHVAESETTLAEDYVTCIAGKTGSLLLGHRSGGIEGFDPATGRCVRDAAQSFVTAIALMPPGRPVIGSYGDGIVARDRNAGEVATNPPPSPLGVSLSFPGHLPFPSGAAAPAADDLERMIQSVKMAAPSSVAVTYLGDDWTTRGDWVGRYGRQFGLLCAMGSPLDHEVSTGPPYFVKACLGAHHTANDSLRRWVHWIKTSDPRSLYSPVVGFRRQSEWDDHGEAYPMAFDGPGIDVAVEVPAGPHRLSFYFFNKDGQFGNNRYRDYVVRVVAEPSTPTPVPAKPAYARVDKFYGGVYATFAVVGPSRYHVQIQRNGSFNTICSGVFIDKLSPLGPLENSSPLPWMGNMAYEAPQLSQFVNAQTGKVRVPQRVRHIYEFWSILDQAELRQPPSPASRKLRIFAYRSAVAADAPPMLLARWRWQQRLWNQNDREEFAAVMASAWSRMQELNPLLKSREFRPLSPNTVAGKSQEP